MYRWILNKKYSYFYWRQWIWNCIQQNGGLCVSALMCHYNTGVQILSCTFSSLREYRVIYPGTHVSKWNLFWQKQLANQFVFQLMLGLEDHYPSSPLGDFNRLFEGQIGVLFKIWHLNMIYFLNGINLAPKMQMCIITLLVKVSWMQCQIVNKPGFHGASCQLAPSNIWTHKVQYLPTAVYW